MYICICNALRKTQLAEAAADPSVEGPACVFKAFGTKPQCGSCVPDIEEMIQAAPPGGAGAIAAE